MRRILILGTLLIAGLAGCLADDDATNDDGMGGNATTLLGSAPEVSAADLLADLADFSSTYGERADNLPTHEGARQWLMDTFASYGLEVYRQNFTDGIDQANIVGIKWGEIRDQWVVVGGHYDTTDQVCALTGVKVPDPVAGVTGACPLRAQSDGAYDDGSGTMMTVHLAKAFANVTTKYTIAFVAFDGEERGTQGARAFVNAFVTGYQEGNYTTPYGKIKVVGDVDLDMIGLNWPGVNAPINVLTNSEALWEEVQNITNRLEFPEGQVIRKDSLQLGSSDYAQFWRVTEEFGGPIPTVFFISDFEELGSPAPLPDQVHTPTPVGYYPFWHFEDTMETMTAMAGGADNLEAGFQSASTVAAHMVWQLAAVDGFMPDAVVM